MSTVDGFRYTLYAEADVQEITQRIETLLAQDEIFVERKTKAAKKKKGKGRWGKNKGPVTQQINLRPMITQLEITNTNAHQVEIAFETRMLDNRVAKPKEIFELLGLNPLNTRVLKRETLMLDEVVAEV
jgi:hypothetical protein